MEKKKIFEKAPSEKLDYIFDWSDWLSEGENIVSYMVIPETGITIDNHSQEENRVIVWISEGKLNETYSISCLITTSENRIAQRTMDIRIVKR